MGKRSWLLLGSVAFVLVLAIVAGYQLGPRAAGAAPHQGPALQEAAVAPSQTVAAEALAKKGGAWLGIRIANAESGVSIQAVTAESPAAKAGVQEGDVITAINGNAITNTKQLVRTVSGLKSGDKITLSVTRAGASQTIEVELGAAPAKAPLRIPMGANPFGGLEGLVPGLSGLGADARFDRFHGATFSYADEDGSPITVNITAGQATAVTTTTITLRPNAGGAEATYQVGSTTKLLGVRRGQLAESVKVGDKVMVIVKQGEAEALAVYDQSALTGRQLLPQGHPKLNPDSKATPNSQFRDRFREELGTLGRRLEQLRQRLEQQPAS